MSIKCIYFHIKDTEFPIDRMNVSIKCNALFIKCNAFLDDCPAFPNEGMTYPIESMFFLMKWCGLPIKCFFCCNYMCEVFY